VGQEQVEVLEASLCYRKAYKPGSASYANERGVGSRWHESKAGRIFLPIAVQVHTSG
jgi:hypothetical protein